ncbi:hypothetical protein [Nakamurella sp.]|uniref:hypothetical protein n=1 Tax=Nakamurella sp. TaxID=1869182 RepID=UPI0037830ECD
MTRNMVAYWTAKEGTARSDWEDGAAYSPGSGWFAVTDGASTGSDSRSWAYALARAVLTDRPAGIYDDGAGLVDWVRQVRAGFDPAAPEFPPSRAPGWVRAASAVRGAHATLLAGRLVGDTVDAVAVGDTCLFHCGADRVEVFPAMAAGDFGSAPALVPSQVRAEDRGLRQAVRRFRTRVTPGDAIFVATDALAEWLVRNRTDDGVWRLLRRIGHTGFEALCADLRARGQAKNDDMTLFRALV